MVVCGDYSELSGLTSCVKAAVHSRCGPAASQLVDVLVRSSVQLSPLCTDAHVTSHTPRTNVAMVTYTPLPQLTVEFGPGL